MAIKPFEVFIGSSTEAKPIAERLVRAIEKHPLFETCPWWKAFPAGVSFYDALISASHKVDFGIFIATKDDIILTRGVQRPCARDNVLFEFALFSGQLGKQRVLLVHTVEALPSDLSGISTIPFNLDRDKYSDLSEKCIDMLLRAQSSSPLDCLLFETVRQIRRRTSLAKNFLDFYQNISLQALPAPSTLSDADAISLFEQIKCAGPIKLPKSNNTQDDAKFYFDLTKATPDTLRKISSRLARRLVEIAQLSCQKTRCATRVAIRKSSIPGNIDAIVSSVMQSGLRPVLVDVSKKEILGPYRQEEKVVLVHDFLNTGFTPLECVGILRNNGLIVDHLVTLCARDSRFEAARNEADKVSVTLSHCFLITDDGKIEASI